MMDKKAEAEAGIGLPYKMTNVILYGRFFPLSLAQVVYNKKINRF